VSARLRPSFHDAPITITITFIIITTIITQCFRGGKALAEPLR